MKLLCISIICILFLCEVDSEVQSEKDSGADSVEYVHIEKHSLQPEFFNPISNETVAVGEDVTLTCTVRQLGRYRVAWIKLKTNGILAVQGRIVTNNRRLTIDHSNTNSLYVSNLHIKSVQEEDQGGYKCEINTSVMKSQIAYLDVILPSTEVIQTTEVLQTTEVIQTTE